VNEIREIGDNVRERDQEQKCFQMLTKGRLRWSRDHTVRQTVSNGGSGDWKGLAAVTTFNSSQDNLLHLITRHIRLISQDAQ